MMESFTNTLEDTKGRRDTPAASVVLPDGTLAEMVYDPIAGRTAFAVSRAGEVRYEERLQLDPNSAVRPYSPANSLIKHEIVLFPSEAIPYGSEAELLAAIRSFIHRYVDLTPLFEELAAYYALFSWLYDGFNELPYLRVKGDTGSGKTRFLLIVGSLCYKPVFASGASTVSPIFRILDLFQGTLVIDEGDFRVSDEKAEIVKILNNGNARGFPVLRSEVTNRRGEFSPRAYRVYGPKLVATRSAFQDRALESRCLTEELGHRKIREDIPINLPAGFADEARVLRNKLLSFRFAHHGRSLADQSLVDPTIEPRLNQVFVPLLSVITEDRTRLALKQLLREYQQQLVADRGLEVDAQVVEVIHIVHEGLPGADLPLRDITSRFIERYAEEMDRKVTPKWIGGIIRRRLGLRTARRCGAYVIPATERPRLEQLYEKYGVASEPDPGHQPGEDFARTSPGL